MVKKLFLFLFFITLLFCMSSVDVSASFGISPADLTFNNLLQGGVYEKEFLISRTDLEKDIKVVVETDVEGADDWFKFEPGVTFTISKGQRTKKMKVIMEVPERVSLKVYEGFINVKTSADENASGVTVVGGVGISVRLAVGEDEIFQLLVRNLEMLNVTEGKQLILLLTVENQGNIKTALEKVDVIISDAFGNEVMKTEGKDFAEILPGRLDELALKFDNNLVKGEYFANVIVYFKGESIKEDKLSFSIIDGGSDIRKVESIDYIRLINILLIFGLITAFILLVIALRKAIKNTYF